MMFGEDRYITTRTGRSVHLRLWGDREPACLFIHGFGEGAYVWEHIAPAVSHDRRVVAVDLCGHGDSDWEPDGRYTTEAHVADVAFIIERLGMRRVVIVGHSLGADIGIRLAARNRGLVTGLVVVDFGVGMSREARQYAHESFLKQFRVYRSVAEYAAVLTASRPLTAEAVVQWVARASMERTESDRYELKCDPRLATCEDRELTPAELGEMMTAVACPTALVRGAASALLSRQAALETARKLHSSQVLVVANAGHAVVTDNPEELTVLIRSFLRQHSRDRAPHRELSCNCRACVSGV